MNKLIRSVLIISSSILFLAGNLQADIIIDDGLVHDIDYAVAESVAVYDDASGNASTVNIYDGAEFSSVMYFWQNSQLNMIGGTVNHDLAIDDDATAYISGGIVNGFTYASGNSTMTLAGNAQTDRCWALGTSTFIVEGDAVVGHLETMDSATAIIRGGRMGYMLLTGAKTDISAGIFEDDLVIGSLDNSISGGEFQSDIRLGGTLEISGGLFEGELLVSTPMSEMTFIGSDFFINEQAIKLGSSISDYELTESIWNGWTCLSGVISGTLEDSTTINQTIRLLSLKDIGFGNVSFVPEPASMWLLLAGCGLLARRKSSPTSKTRLI